ncbi:MAG: hypothetical protein AAF439_02510 [Pseudomonadota bacterium]
MAKSASFPTVSAFASARAALPAGVVAVLLCESARHVQASAERLAEQGAAAIIYVGREEVCDLEGPAEIAIAERPRTDRYRKQLNALFDALDGRWVLWLWNAEFFVFPYCETRSLAEMTGFLQDERRRVLFSYALDLYGTRLPAAKDDPRQTGLCFDRIGYHAFPKPGQQLRVYGGLGWRFEELAPRGMQQIGRSCLIRAQRGQHLNREMLFGDDDYDSVSCKWHNSPTGAVMTLRRSSRIMAHENFPAASDRLMWQGTTAWDWSSQQLLELGMIEPGQWF